MAFDISSDTSSPSAAPAPANFEEFYVTQADTVVAALALACQEPRVAAASSTAALTQASQRWPQLALHGNQAGWTINAGLEHAEATLREHEPSGLNIATGGYVRGLTIDRAFATLPLRQRAALVTGYYLDWSDVFTAAGFEVAESTIRTRRGRAMSFLGHHLRTDEATVTSLLRAHLGLLAEQQSMAVPELAAVRRLGRRRTARNRVVGFLAVIALVVVGGSIFRAGNRTPVVAELLPVAAPSTSVRWFGPVSDGNGSFVALNTAGAADFVRSSDGAEWFDLTTWNSRAINVRADVSSFQRSSGRYIAVLEIPARLEAFVPPYIATSTDLREWNVRQIEAAEPRAVEGLQSRYDVVASATSGDRVLVALESSTELDYRSFGVTPDDVCAESSAPARREFFLCNGESIGVTTPQQAGAADTRYFQATADDVFLEVQLPPQTVARSLVGFDGGFAIVDEVLGHVWVSSNGEQWERATSSTTVNRFVLLEGSADGQADAGTLVIEPDSGGWRSQVVLASGLGAVGELPLGVDPALVWSEPDLASGPAGWAMFVTTSRPWERTEGTPGWAVVADEWIVSRLPNSELVTAQSTRTSTTARFVVGSQWARIDAAGTIVLINPTTGVAMVEVTQQDIARARPSALDASRIKAQVLFSVDGVTWRSVWSSTDDAWSGSLAVGDDELVLSGTQLTGAPITIPLDG